MSDTHRCKRRCHLMWRNNPCSPWLLMYQHKADCVLALCAWFQASIDLQTVLSRSCGGKGPSAPREHSPAQGYQSHQRRTGAGVGRTGLASSSPRMTVPPFPRCLCSSPSSQPGSFHQNRDEVLKWWGRAAAPLDSTLLVAPLQKAPTPSLWDSLLAELLPLGLSIPWQKHPAPTFSISFLEKPN